MSSENDGPSPYRSRPFITWRISVQYSYANNSAWTATWYAEKATELAAIADAPDAVIDLAEACRFAADSAARNAAIAGDILRRAKAGGPLDHTHAWQLAEHGAEFCDEARQRLKEIQTLLEGPTG